MDTVDRVTRSRMMSGIRSKNTKPELLLRKQLFARGFRYLINVKKLPGTPDIVLPMYNTVIFVHGCFWHGHDCRFFRLPATRTEFWTEKINKNRERDARALNELHALGWRICIVWECSLRGKKHTAAIQETVDTISGWLRSESVWLEITGENICNDPIIPSD